MEGGDCPSSKDALEQGYGSRRGSTGKCQEGQAPILAAREHQNCQEFLSLYLAAGNRTTLSLKIPGPFRKGVKTRNEKRGTLLMWEYVRD